VVQVAGLAFQARRPAKLALAVGELAGPHWNDYQNTVENAPIDHTMTVVQATDERGAPIVTLLNWGCHPTTENGKNLLISSDWVGAYYREIATDDVGIPLFVNGSIGASIQPSEPWREEHVGTEEQGQGFVWADAFGRAVAERTRLLLAELEPLEVERIEVRNAVVATTLENRLFSLARALGVLSFDLPALHQPLNTRITQASLGELRLATVPGELSPQLGMLIREAVGGRAQIICGLSQDYFGYIIDSEQYADDRLKYERMLCISPELGLSLVQAHRELAGR